MNKTLHLPALAGAILLLTGCATMTGSELDLTDEGRLPPCPSTPNCVSSDADPSDGTHYIEALKIDGDAQAAWQRLIGYVESDSSYTIVEQRENYLRAEARTKILRFVDDVIFHLRPEEGVIAMRSSSRLGYSDLGKNRKRLEAVRQALNST
ncbi:DUF1499 domain-containing protein [Lentisalinibacter sediminis]|uniref:DUF1499 domain-containing protein n=1 Tax=Lentisalinibacter sediminis TaxID=2992237 RepID=UPI00386E4D1E